MARMLPGGKELGIEDLGDLVASGFQVRLGFGIGSLGQSGPDCAHEGSQLGAI
jgi:hypothetical protein